MAQLQLAAARGHYLRPFATIMLALAYERDGQSQNAQQLLTDPATEFPGNPVFSHELELVNKDAPKKSKR
jgi:hypothetical protein